MKRLLGDIRRADEDFSMIRKGDRVAVGVSGGKDSLVLLHALKIYSQFSNCICIYMLIFYYFVNNFSEVVSSNKSRSENTY